jgi:HTH-type transcriptional regulator / antitoxin MqsA
LSSDGCDFLMMTNIQTPVFRCHVCGSNASHSEHVSEVFNIGERFHLVEKIPATVCSQCSEKVFSQDATERIRIMLHGEETQSRSSGLMMNE